LVVRNGHVQRIFVLRILLRLIRHRVS
jgi:hypothetical protein